MRPKLSGDTLALGLTGLNSSKGAVDTYKRSESTWEPTGRLTAPDGQVNDGFGWSLALGSNTLVIGAPALNVRTGSVYVYNFADGAWTFAQKLQVPSSILSNLFGDKVDLSGTTFIVSCFRDKGTPETPVGAAYIYSRPSASQVAVAGRVLTLGGQGLRNAVVSLTGPDGMPRTVATSTLGYYNFPDVATGNSYVIAVSSRRYRFEQRTVDVNSDLTNVDFTGLE